VRDHDELGAIGELAKRLSEATDVPFVERRVDLVEHAKRRGPHPQDREEQGRRRKGALAAGQLVEAPDPLPRRACIDVDPRLVWIIARAK
jgi:hypothetical protein